MDIRILKYFLAVAREENITRAAETLHISQPSLSNQLMQLEKELGKILLIRGKRRITLTEDGLLLRKRADEIVSLFEKTERELLEDSRKIAGSISIGSGESEAMNYLIQTMRELSSQYPDIHYHLFSGDAQAIMEQLDHGILDFGILMEPVDLSKYERLHLPVSDTWGLLLPSGDFLSEQTSIQPEDLQDLPLLVPRRIGLQHEISGWMHRDFQSLNIIATYNLVYNASLMVKAGLGYALVLDKLINTSLDHSLSFRPLSPAMTVSLSIAWKKYQVFSRPSGKFIELLKSRL